MQNEYLEFDFENQEHLDILLQEATSRNTIFKTKEKTLSQNIFTLTNTELDQINHTNSTEESQEE